MKKTTVVLALGLLLLLGAIPTATADPGNGNGWESVTAQCDQGPLDIVGHEGLWSATHLADGGRLILTAQTITVGGEVVLDLEHPGHKNQTPDVTNCSFDLPGEVTISLTGFFR